MRGVEPNVCRGRAARRWRPLARRRPSQRRIPGCTGLSDRDRGGSGRRRRSKPPSTIRRTTTIAPSRATDSQPVAWGQPRRVATWGPTWPVSPSSRRDSANARDHSPEPLDRRGRALAVAHVSEPARARSQSNTARVAPSDTASRSAFSALGGPIDSAHTSAGRVQRRFQGVKVRGIGDCWGPSPVNRPVWSHRRSALPGDSAPARLARLPAISSTSSSERRRAGAQARPPLRSVRASCILHVQGGGSLRPAVHSRIPPPDSNPTAHTPAPACGVPESPPGSKRIGGFSHRVVTDLACIHVRRLRLLPYRARRCGSITRAVGVQASGFVPVPTEWGPGRPTPASNVARDCRHAESIDPCGVPGEASRLR